MEKIVYLNKYKNEDSPANSYSVRQNRMLSQLEVEVGIELGSVSLSAAALIDWAVGEKVAFSVHPDDAVLLTIAGEKVAKAYLRKDGEELFLEIAELYEETFSESERIEK